MSWKEAETEVILKVAERRCVSWHRSPAGKLRCGRVCMRQEKMNKRGHLLKSTGVYDRLSGGGGRRPRNYKEMEGERGKE